MTLNFDVSQLVAMAQRVNTAEATIGNALRNGVQAAAQRGVQLARGNLQNNGSVVTGGLSRDIKVLSVAHSGSSVTAIYGPSQDKPAQWVENGRGPVRARAGGKLAFRIKGKGALIITDSVRAAAPKPFMEPTKRQVAPYAKKLIHDAILTTIRDLV